MKVKSYNSINIRSNLLASRINMISYLYVFSLARNSENCENLSVVNEQKYILVQTLDSDFSCVSFLSS